jgi:excisionase family DNA binding protein
MSDILTTRQLQELIQVDRITIYRMLNDGRLTGFKVGGQWRFSRQEIEKWLQEQGAVLPISEIAGGTTELALSSHVLPLPCIQAIQAVYAEALEVAAITTEPDGTPLTQISNSCQFCDLILSTLEGRRRCAASWLSLEVSQQLPPPMRTCHAGLLCIGLPIIVEDQWVASVTSCQFVARSPAGMDEGWQISLPALAADLGLIESDLQAAANSVRALSDEQMSRLAHLLEKVAATFREIGQERQKLVGRLQRIAEMSNI